VIYFATRGSGEDDSPGKRAEKPNVPGKDEPARKPAGEDIAAKPASPDAAAVTAANGQPLARAGEPTVHTALKPAVEAAPAEFAFPEDSGGKLLSRTLTPPAVLPPERTIGPEPRNVPRAIENPGLPASKEVASLPRLDSEPKRRPALPFFVAPEQTLDGHELPAGLPQSLQFPVGDRLKVPSISVEQPIDLPLMAQPLPDTATVSDPTHASSRDAVLSATMPARTVPAPFMIFGTPDPFENHDVVKIRGPGLGEELVPPATGSQTPRR
jgi:hypothetical protein